MDLNTTYVGSTAVLRLSGRFDAHTAPAVGDWLEKATAAPPAQVVIDLDRVLFVDSTALAVLVRGMKRARQQAGDLYLASLQAPVRVIFELTRLDRAFQIVPTVEAALAAIAE